MRVLGVSKEWPKLKQDVFTTFRFPRRDKDWQPYEFVRIVLHPRRKGGGTVLGTAQIHHIEPRRIVNAPFLSYKVPIVTDREAVADGFLTYNDMRTWLAKAYGESALAREPMNKLTLHWVRREVASVVDNLGQPATK